MSEMDVLYRAEDGVAIISLNRPKALNALTTRLVTQLNEALDRARDDAQVRAVVMTGEGRGFCSGADLASAQRDAPRDAQGRVDLGASLESMYNPVVARMRAMPKPVVSAVNGMAAGAGANIALLADLTIAGRSSYFLQAFVNIGLVPDVGGTWILPRTLGAQRAMGLAMLGERLPAEKALEWGLIWDVADDDALMDQALALARRLAAGPTAALARIKQAIQAAADNDLTTQLALERDLQRESGYTADFAEGVTAFLQKRKAEFKGC